MNGDIHYGKDKMTIPQAMDLCMNRSKGRIDPETLNKISISHQRVAEIVRSKTVVYGINTGFGVLANTIISAADTSTLQSKILQSHSVGVGDYIPPRIARLMMITKMHSLAQGYSGIHPDTLHRIQWFIDHDITPLVPEKGSVGASGDLAPLAHCFLPLIGLGEVLYKGKQTKTKEVLIFEKMKPIELGPKEGLALINGTQFMLSYAIDNVVRCFNCLEAADVIGAMSLEALTGTKSPFDPRIHALRPFRSIQLVARRLSLLLQDSSIMQSHVECGRVQDPYSLRCMPQVHGASRNAWNHLKEITEIELNAVTDNPIIFSGGETISGGNFHGQPLALPLDYLSFAAAELGNISDRRTYLLLEGKWGLPLLLMKNVGLNSGFMIPQYTTAALVSENKSLAFPASVDSIPTSLGQEDHVSMGSISGRKLSMILDNLEYILAIELMTACQAIEFRRPLKSSKILEEAHQFVRRHVSFAEEDRVFADDINKIKKIIQDHSFVRHINETAHELNIPLNKEYAEFNL